MIRIRSAALALCLALAACQDTRRDAARAHVLAHPPMGFELVAPPESIPVKDVADGEGEALVSVRYRLLRPTIEVRDGFDLPRGRELASQLTELRGWALGALPAGQPIRESLLGAVAQARSPFPVKRIVTPAGAEVDALVSLRLRKAGDAWRVTEFQADASVPGAPDTDAAIPFEEAPEVAARFDQLAAAVRQLETTRREYLAERAQRAAQSLAKLRAHLQTGRTFEGRLPDGTPVRVVISHGLEGGTPGIVVVTTRGATGESTARFTGSLLQQPSGETVWRAAQVLTLSAPAEGPAPAATDATIRPVLTLFSAGADLDAHLKVGDAAPLPLALRPAPSVDLIPDPAQSPTTP